MSNPAEPIEVDGERIGFVQQMNGPGSLTGKWQAGDGKPHKFIQAWNSRDEAVSYLLERRQERATQSQPA